MANGSNAAAMSQLNERIDALDLRGARIDTARLAADLDALRRLAALNGFSAVTPIVHAIEAALARGEQGPAIANGMSLLRDAACCGADPRSATLLAAAYLSRICG